jgi:tetratricopeptide (TPR) repeat protein
MGRNTRFSIVFCWCISFIFFATPWPAPGFQFGRDSYSISGKVYDQEAQQILTRVEVTLRENGVMREHVVTNESGRFDFEDVGRGSYEIIVSAQGYLPYSTALSPGEGDTRGLTIYLKRAASRETPAGYAASAHELSMPQKARDLMYAGKQQVFFSKNLEAGLKNLRDAVAIAPDYYEAYYQMGMTYLETGKRAEALQSFRKSIELSNNRYGEPIIGIGTMLIDQGDSVAAEKLVRSGLEYSPNFWLGHYELARACLAQNRLDDAKKAAEQARSLMPNAAIVYRLLANIHFSEKNYPALLNDLDAYLKIDSDGPAAVHAKEMRTDVLQRIQNEKLVTETSEAK